MTWHPKTWRNPFKAHEPALPFDGVVAAAVEEQAAFEEAHPVAYALDQRITAVCQRAQRIASRQGVKLPVDLPAVVEKALQ
jgi:hypothetical protein